MGMPMAPTGSIGWLGFLGFWFGLIWIGGTGGVEE